MNREKQPGHSPVEQTANPSDPTDPEAAPRFLEELVRQGETAGASDIHLQLHGGGADIAFRLDGVLAPGRPIPRALAERVVGRIKYLARLKTYQDSLPQDGRIDHQDLGTRNDLRVATYPALAGEKVVLRLFQSSSIRSFAELGIAEPAEAELERFLGRTTGLMLLTGPAGSGKTTTIYACLQRLASAGGRHIITIEDPAEQLVPGVMQTEVDEPRGLTFARAARHLLRQDPQVLVIGEIRDEETAGIAVRAALTGHLVISTLHAGSCGGVIERLGTLCPDGSAIAASLDLVLNQRLLRRICPDCRAKGCDACLGTGYRGRLPLIEWLRITDALRPALARRQSADLKAAPALADSARALVRSGLTTAVEARRILGADFT
ncbi:MAG: ATPase, T2SS/T4P/T4SS family [Verrucomicrobiota bacterium]